ncbi:MAG: flagellar basal body rod protein FlgB [Pseudorhodoplanes sp.]
MAISELPILSMLRTRMQWHQERQKLLSENVSNADTPGFRPRDLAPPKFDSPPMRQLMLAATNPLHLMGGPGGASQFEDERNDTYETRPTGNAVSLEDEMMKVAANQMEYQAATTLYAKSLGLVKTALGKK